jgi:hypothetical protein
LDLRCGVFYLIYCLSIFIFYGIFLFAKIVFVFIAGDRIFERSRGVEAKINFFFLCVLYYTIKKRKKEREENKRIITK